MWSIGQLLLRGLLKKGFQSAQIEIRLQINLKGVLRMQAREYSSSPAQEKSLMISKQMSLLSEQQVIEIWKSNLSLKSREYTSLFRKPVIGGYTFSAPKDLPGINNAISLLKKVEYKVFLYKYVSKIQVFLASDWLLQFIPFLTSSIFASIFTSLLLKVYSKPMQHLHFMSKFYILLGAFYFCLHNTILPFLRYENPYLKSHMQNILSLLLSIPFTACVVRGLRALSPSRAYLLAMYLGLPFLYTVPSLHSILLSSREGNLILVTF